MKSLKLYKLLPLIILMACENSVEIQKRVDSPSLPPEETPHVPGPLHSEDLSCFSNVNGGIFGGSVEINLACNSSVAEIKYCLQEGSCCDPHTSGNLYTGPITLGMFNENTCLSFYGERGDSHSQVVNHTYRFDGLLPDLQLNFPKTLYQTTQLEGHHFLGSNDFGKTNYTVGEFNFKNYDPAFNVKGNCEDIFENFVELQALNPSPLLNPFDMSLLSWENQLKIPLSLNDLNYGENFIASFVANNNYDLPLYACSANKITLMDFDFFAFEASHGDDGADQLKDDSGSFVAYGFFESDPDIHRDPAGLSIEEKSGQELRVGSFGIFY